MLLNPHMGASGSPCGKEVHQLTTPSPQSLPGQGLPVLTFMYTKTLLPLISFSICLVTSTRLSAYLALKSSFRSACAQAEEEARPRCENPTRPGMLISRAPSAQGARQ